jgi:predicted lipid-binding transport protein (Tim44 family)
MVRVKRSLRAGGLALLLVLAGGAGTALGRAGGGSSGFGGGGGGGGGGSGGSGGSGDFDPKATAAIIVLGLLILAVIAVVARVKLAARRRRRDEREREVERAALEAAEDDAAFDADRVREGAQELFTTIQRAWSEDDRARLRELVGPDLMVEWDLRLQDFAGRGWRNVVSVEGEPRVDYVGLTNRAEEAEDRVVVCIEAKLEDHVVDGAGARVQRKDGQGDALICEYWTLAKRNGSWIVVSIEQAAEGEHQLKAPLVATPWSDDRLRDEALVELAAGEALPEGFRLAEVADLDFEEDAHGRALDLSLADGRFAPDVLEAAARRAVEAWAEAVDGDDAALAAVASPEALAALLYGDDPSRRTRVVVRGPGVRRIHIADLDAEAVPATLTVEVELGGRRYVEDRDTAALLSGSQDRATTFTEVWTLALDGPDDSPWRLVAVDGAGPAASPSPDRAASR